jgi:RNA polymerase sigma-B factor
VTTVQASAGAAGAGREAWLLARYREHGDVAARDQLVEQMLPLVRSVAGAYAHPGHVEDLRQVAALGLVKAIERFDPAHGVPLRTYAIPTMFGEVRRYLRDHAWALRVPRPLQERVLATTKAIERLSARDGHAPTPSQVADEIGCDIEETLEALQAASAYSAVSLDAPTGVAEDGARTVADAIGYDDERLDRAEDIAALRGLRHVLDDRDREILHLRFVEDLSQTEIARRMGVSQMHISRLIRRALGRLADAARA